MSMVSGNIPLNDGHRFFWMVSEDQEVYGFVETKDHEIVPKSSGWYRTGNPEIAAQSAAFRFGFTVACTTEESDGHAA